MLSTTSESLLPPPPPPPPPPSKFAAKSAPCMLLLAAACAAEEEEPAPERGSGPRVATRCVLITSSMWCVSWLLSVSGAQARFGTVRFMAPPWFLTASTQSTSGPWRQASTRSR